MFTTKHLKNSEYQGDDHIWRHFLVQVNVIFFPETGKSDQFFMRNGSTKSLEQYKCGCGSASY